MTKKLILVTSPPACGKTYISKELAKRLKHIVYLDKDTLITLSKQIFVVAGQEYNRSSDLRVIVSEGLVVTRAKTGNRLTYIHSDRKCI